MTRKKQKNNKSGITGVSYDPIGCRWKSYITRNKILRYKYFDNQVDAIEWRKKQEDYYRINGRFNISYDI